MTRDEAKIYCKDYLATYLQAKGLPLSKAFRCLNPAHNDAHASMQYDKRRNKAHCFSCGADYDIYDLIGIDYGLTEQIDIFNKTYEYCGVSIDENARNTNESRTQKTEPKAKEINTMAPGPTTVKLNLTDTIEQAHKALLNNEAALKHFTDRGLTIDTIKQYKIGYSVTGYNTILQAYKDNQTGSRKEGLYKYILPYIGAEGEPISYFTAEIEDRQQVDTYNGKYRLIKGINAQLFNERYFYERKKEPLFIFEGIYDALSVEQAGGKAIALNGVGESKLLKLCKEYKPAYMIIYTDTDTAGQEAIERISKGLTEQGIPYRTIQASAGKDANDDYLADREAFTEKIQTYIAEAKQELLSQEEAEKEAYLNTSAGNYVTSFIEDIKSSKNKPYYPTGFNNLDNIIDEGLRAGLYTIGAISSLGKTTFCLQIADYVAKSGYDVLYFSLEMARSEIMAKSISRETMALDIIQNETTANAKTTIGILSGKRYENYNATELQLITDATEAYSEYAKHIYIYEGIGNIGVKEIREAIKRHIKYAGEAGRRPLVVIDYVQILAPYIDEEHPNRSLTDKQTVDKNILELKRISRDYDIPILGISSFNRDSYTEPVSMAAFKESGAVEYTSDVLIGLQYKGMDYRTFTKTDKNGNQNEVSESTAEHAARVNRLIKDNKEKAKNGQPQEVEIKILKNRNGKIDSATLNFYPMFNRFIEGESNINDAMYWIKNPAQTAFKPRKAI